MADSPTSEYLAPEPRSPHRACPACASTRARRVGSDAGYVWLRCACSLAFVQERVSDADLAEYYSGYYAGASSPPVPPFVHARLGQLLARLEKYRKSGRLLDIGYGAGTFLAVAHARGWDCWGTEIADSGAQLPDDRMHLLHGRLEHLDIPDSTFDIVSMIEVLEHVPEPAAYVAAAARLLRPGGALYITTPNASGLSGRLLGASWSAYAPPEHLQLFTPASLRLLLERYGLSMRECRTEAANPSEIRRHFHRRQAGVEEPFSRVLTAYSLNEHLSRTRRGRMLRQVANGALRATRTGDTIKVVAHRPALS